MVTSYVRVRIMKMKVMKEAGDQHGLTRVGNSLVALAPNNGRL